MNSNGRFIRGRFVVTTACSHSASLVVAFGSLSETARQDADASIFVAVEALRREAFGARYAPVVRDLA